MKLQKILLVGMIVELCFVPLLDAKRSFGITRSRNKGNKPSVRRNHGHEFDDTPVPAVHPKPSAPDMRKSVGQNVHSAPAGPPPAYPGMGHHSAAPYGAPPAYSPSYSNPPGYSSHTGFNQPRYNQGAGGFTQPGHNQFNSYSSGPAMMPMGVMPMSSMPMGGGYGYGSGGMGSGMMTNLFAGLAGYQLARAFSGSNHHHRDREVIVIDNRQPINSNPAETPANVDHMNHHLHESPSTFDPSTAELPPQAVTQSGPANNEYNYWGSPQYGIPLYGYNLPTQITDYYQTAIVTRPRNSPPPTYEHHQPMNDY